MLQRRTHRTDHYSGLWSISVAGHVEAGESSQEAVKRELNEELDLAPEGEAIQYVCSYRKEVSLSPTYIDRQWNDIYACWIDWKPARMAFDARVVSEVKWVPFSVFAAMVQTSTKELVPVYEEGYAALMNWLQAHHRQVLLP